MKKILASVFPVLLFGVLMSGCEREGPAERTGKNIDNAVEKAGDKLDEAGDELKEKTQH